MSEKIIGTIYTKVRFEAVIRNKKTDGFGIKDVFVEYPSSVIYEAGGKEKVAEHMTLTDHDIWVAAIARTQPLTTYGETGELLSLRKRETTFEKRQPDRQRSLFDAIREEKDELNAALRAEANERYDQMIGR